MTTLRFASLAAAAAAALVSTIGLAADGPARFERDGRTYVYTAMREGDRTIITGRSYPGSAPFRLVVRGAMVTGVADGRQVAFRVPTQRRAPAILAAAD